MIFPEKEYSDFLTGSLTFDGKKVFGDIISDEFARERNNETIDNVKKNLSYWEDIKALEIKLGHKILDKIKKDDNTLLSRYLLDLEEQKDTKAEIRYFPDKESAMGNQK